MGMSVVITAGAAVGTATIEGGKPAIYRGPFLPKFIPLVIEKAAVHAFDVGNEHQISAAEILEEPGTGIAPKSLADSFCLGGKQIGSLHFCAGITEPSAPGPEQIALQLPQR